MSARSILTNSQKIVSYLIYTSQIFHPKNNNFKKTCKRLKWCAVHTLNMHPSLLYYRVLCKQRCKGLQKIQSILKQIEVDWL